MLNGNQLRVQETDLKWKCPLDFRTVILFYLIIWRDKATDLGLHILAP